jgi:hypothetical protein
MARYPWRRSGEQMQDVQNDAYFVGWIPNNVLTAWCDIPPSFTTHLCFLGSLIYSTRDFNHNKGPLGTPGPVFLVYFEPS